MSFTPTWGIWRVECGYYATSKDHIAYYTYDMLNALKR